VARKTIASTAPNSFGRFSSGELGFGSVTNRPSRTSISLSLPFKENKVPDVVPFLTYEDGITALEWLAEVFGFTETARFTSSDGRLAHGEMSIGDGLVMLASPSPDYEGPKRHRDHCAIAASWSALPWVIDGVLVYVDDVDEHYARAKAAGAVILSEPEDGPPARRYRVEDLEGHRWMFMARG
jgi:uncharacterized glyoxalase superfamily protein PhnB